MGGRNLDNAIRDLETVTSLDLGSSGISAEGAARLSQALLQNTTVTSLDLGFNRIGDEERAWIRTRLQRNAAGVRVITVFPTVQNSGRIHFSCVAAGGDEVVALELAAHERAEMLVDAIAQHAPHPGHLKVMLPDGRFVGPELGGTSTLAQLLALTAQPAQPELQEDQ